MLLLTENRYCIKAKEKPPLPYLNPIYPIIKMRPFYIYFYDAGLKGIVLFLEISFKNAFRFSLRMSKDY